MNQPLLETTKKQARASSPEISAWVSANAGSGKTYVLARRVLRLMLNGANPGSLVCLTYTKTAAAEMQARVFKALSEWTRLSDDDLNQTLSSGYSIERPNSKIRARARTLFAEATETPGGLKIQTIHAFCERILHQFPLEANVPGRFQVIDDRLKEELLLDARQRTILAALSTPESAIGQALGLLLEDGSDGTVTTIVQVVTKEQEKLQAWHNAFPDLFARQNSLAAALGETRYQTLEEIAAVTNAVLQENKETWRAVLSVLSKGSKSEVTASQTLAKSLSNNDPELLTTLFVTQDGQPRKRSLFVKKTAQANPDLFDFLEVQKDVLAGAVVAGRITHCIDKSIAAIGFGLAVAELYNAEKLRRGALDYDDLIEKTRALLTSADAALWVQYKLDQGIDHILVDEAQDTSPAQWEIVASLSGEFFAGAGGRQQSRTVFAVGDEKQSIFSFQGASPAEFDHQKESYRLLASQSEKGFTAEQLEISFRSTPAILSAVDAVFENPVLSKALTASAHAPSHQANRSDAPGFVEVWPLAARTEEIEPQDWTTPIDRKSEHSDPLASLSEKIASTISAWITGRVEINVDRAQIRPQDIMILVRERRHMLTINRALKSHNIPVAGIDRFNIGTHIATDDLMALIQFVLLPQDDLTLASLLRSPLVGLSEEDLFQLSYDRPGSLWLALQDASKKGDTFLSILEKLQRWRRFAETLSPYRFLARILIEDGGRQAFRSRLGYAVDDILDEFLNITIDYEDHHPATLQGFHAYMAQSDEEIKRQMDEARNEVRIMTVHGAKGLEAPIVFLVDDSGLPGTGHKQPKLVFLEEAGVEIPFWQPRDADRPARLKQLSQDHKAVAYDEYIRLLYVAMTRAEDALVVCGIERKNGAPDSAWHSLVLNGLKDRSKELLNDEGETQSWVYEVGKRSKITSDKIPQFSEQPAQIPSWLTQAAPKPKAQPRYEAASSLAPDQSFIFSPRPSTSKPVIDPARKGTLIHTLFEHLPKYEPKDRLEIADNFLNRRAGDLAPEIRQQLKKEAFSILDDPHFSALFGPLSKAEVSIAGQVLIKGEIKHISGRIDRLYRDESRIVIVDFKTNLDPQPKDAIAQNYALQLGAYAHIIEELYPGRQITAGLLWTTLPRFDVYDRDTLHDFITM